MYGMTDSALMRFDFASKNWESANVAGTATKGICPDKTVLATNCDMRVTDAIVSPFGNVYIWDADSIRTIDSAGYLRTVVGQRISDGDGGPALNARIANVASFDILSSPGATRLVFIENSEYKMREINFDGNDTIQHIAGNGKDGSASTAGVHVKNLPGSFTNVQIHPVANEVYVGRNGSIQKINSNNEWERVVFRTTGSLYWDQAEADGVPGMDIRGDSSAHPMLLEADKLIVSLWKVGMSYMKMYDPNDSFRQYNLAGGVDPDAGINGRLGSQTGSLSQAFTGAGAPYVTNMTYDAVSSELLFLNTGDANDKKYITRYPYHNANADYDYNDPGDTYNFYLLPDNANAFASIRNASNELVIYYCTTTGIVKKYNVTTDGPAVSLTSNFNSITCPGRNMKIDRHRRSVIFPFQLNNLWGFAEIVDTADIPPP